jgi:hypothetical protein
MKANRFAGALLALALSGGAACGFVSAQTGDVYQPQVGQEGKDVVWVPTPDALVQKMLDIAKVTAKDYVIDLGSGDGRTVIAAARRGARALGVEYNPEMVELSKRRAAAAGIGNRADFVKADLFETDLSEASVITLFLLPDINLKLRPKLLDLKPGTRVVSNTFTMGEWQADEIATIPNCSAWCTALLWIIPAKAEGAWRLSDGELTLKQNFQMLSGSLRTGDRSMPVTNGKLVGNQITFSAGGAQYTGTVNGNVMEGSRTARGATSAWRAERSTDGPKPQGRSS